MEIRFQLDDIVKIAKTSRFYNDGCNHNPKDVEGRVTNMDEFHITVTWIVNDRSYDDIMYEDKDLRLVRRQSCDL